MTFKKQRAKHKKLQSENFINIIMIDVAFYNMFVDKQSKKRDIQFYFLIIKEIDDVLIYCKSNLNFVDVIVVTKKIINNIMKKIFDCLKHLSQLFNFKKIEKLLSYRFYDHKIEFIANFKNLSKSKVYFLLVRKFETFQKYFITNLKKISLIQTMHHSHHRYYSSSN